MGVKFSQLPVITSVSTTEDSVALLDVSDGILKRSTVDNILLPKLGNLDSLQTAQKSNVVAAINEVATIKDIADTAMQKANTNELKIGAMNTLQTQEKGNLVSAINEVFERGRGSGVIKFKRILQNKNKQHYVNPKIGTSTIMYIEIGKDNYETAPFQGSVYYQFDDFDKDILLDYYNKVISLHITWHIEPKYIDTTSPSGWFDIYDRFNPTGSSDSKIDVIFEHEHIHFGYDNENEIIFMTCRAYITDRGTVQLRLPGTINQNVYNLDNTGLHIHPLNTYDFTNNAPVYIEHISIEVMD